MKKCDIWPRLSTTVAVEVLCFRNGATQRKSKTWIRSADDWSMHWDIRHFADPSRNFYRGSKVRNMALILAPVARASFRNRSAYMKCKWTSWTCREHRWWLRVLVTISLSFGSLNSVIRGLHCVPKKWRQNRNHSYYYYYYYMSLITLHKSLGGRNESCERRQSRDQFMKASS